VIGRSDGKREGKTHSDVSAHILSNVSLWRRNSSGSGAGVVPYEGWKGSLRRCDVSDCCKGGASASIMPKTGRCCVTYVRLGCAPAAEARGADAHGMDGAAGGREGGVEEMLWVVYG
jgi:hypothetical protein